MKLSIVTTLYKSSAYIEDFYNRCSIEAKKFANEDYEIIFVNDGSPDCSLSEAVKLTLRDHHIVVIDLSRNFGHHKAIMTGLAQAIGEYVFLIDSDLEEDPEWLTTFSSQMKLESADVVYGIQESRKGNWFERWSGELYYSALNLLTDINHPRNVVTARLMSRRYVNALMQFQEREMVISCLWAITGFKQSEVKIKKHMTSVSTYTIVKKLNYAINSIVSFSSIPLHFIFYFGLFILIFALLYATYLVILRLSLSTPLEGWTSVMISVWILGGMIISFLGLIGIYLSKVFSETKRRPLTIIREVYQRQSLEIDEATK